MQWALRFVILLSVAGGCQSYRDRKTIHAFIAAASPQLTPQRGALGAVEAEGNELTLLDGALTLAFRVPHGEDDVGRLVHLHALATPRGRATGGLDLCLVGADLSEAVDALVKSALPPVVSAVRDEPLLGATHTWSDTVHGIDGQSAFLGDYRVRGDADDPLISRFIADGVFAGMPQLPHDGRMHLVKVVALAKDGELRRTVELDGAAKIEDGKLVGGRSAGSGANARAGSGANTHAGSAANAHAVSPSMLVAFAVLDGGPDPQPDERLRAEARRRLAAHPAWLPDPAVCPAKIFPRSFGPREWDPVAARGGRLLHAFRGCEAGSGELCYSAAQELLAESSRDPAAESLFLRACQLGNASACTNAAADRPEQDDCAFETYEASCERGNDPWGCVMLGATLVNGDEKHRDIERARKVLPKGCALGDGDPACQQARGILHYLDASPAAGRTP